jgi:hypothetical protein
MSRRPDSRDAIPVLPPEKVEDVRSLLERILSSHHFRSSRRCVSLLRHIVERTLAGDAVSLKERTLGVEVFGRAPDYDTSQDPVVRATAAEIRKRLAQYYQEPGHESEAGIELLSGSYIADFHFNGGGVAQVHRARKRTAAIVGGAAVAVLLILAAGLAIERPKRSPLDQLWSPLLQTPGTTLICVGQPIVYNLKSIQAQDAIQGILAPESSGGSADRSVIARKDLLILSDRYVDLGDAICLTHMTSLLERYGKPYRIRGERSTSFADLSEGPSILIGAFNNQWTIRAAGQLRFSFVKDSAHAIDMVRDQQHPEDTRWGLTGVWPYWDVSHDYAIVSRVLDTTTNRPVIIAAGITQHGTMAAGAFLSNPEYFSDAVALLPAGWQKKNLQVVLHVPVVHRVAGRPRVLAAHVW